MTKYFASWWAVLVAVVGTVAMYLGGIAFLVWFIVSIARCSGVGG